jgi:hypothetical protein
MRKNVSQIIAEMDADLQEQARQEEELQRTSKEMIDWLYAQLDTHDVRVRFNGADIKLISDGVCIGVDRNGKMVCGVVRRQGGVMVEHQKDTPTFKEPHAYEYNVVQFHDYEKCLRHILELLHADCLDRPQDTRDPFQKREKLERAYGLDASKRYRPGDRPSGRH